MIMSLRIAAWLRFVCVASIFTCGLAWVAAGLSTSVQAQERASRGRAASSNPAVATDGATLIHGNYCGAGNRPGKPPIDALDLACMNHDACSPTGGVPTCECNARLRDEAAAVAQDPRQAPELRSLATLTSAAATVMICNPTRTDVATPPVVAAPVPPRPAAIPAPDSAAVAPPAAPPSAPVAAAPSPPASLPSVAVNAPVIVDRPATTAPLSIVPSTVATESAAPEAAAPEAAPAASAPPVPAETPSATVEPRARSLP